MLLIWGTLFRGIGGCRAQTFCLYAQLKNGHNCLKIQYGRHRRTEMYISFGLSKEETRMKCAFACFYILVQAVPVRICPLNRSGHGCTHFSTEAE